MKVKAATVEQHEFAVRRRGYDRAEVDAVMGRLSSSLLGYEEDIQDLEARLSAEETRPATVHREVELIRMESEQMRQQATETLARARQQAEELLDAARGEIDKLFATLNNDAIEVLDAAERDAAAQHEAAAAEANQVLTEARASADNVTTEAKENASQTQAEAEAETRRLLADAGAAAVSTKEAAAAEAAQIVAQARAEHDRLAKRIPELRSALSQFEAQVHALATAEEALDLNEVEAEERVEQATAAIEDEITEVANETAEATAEDGMPAPDGSGTLPAARDLVNLTDYRDRQDDEQDAVANEIETAEEQAAERRKELVAGSHIARRTPGSSEMTETIYQRRGGGLRRRIKAQGDE